MAHPVVYTGDFTALLRQWEDQRLRDLAQSTPKITLIANGECARLPQALTSVGHTSRWMPGERVVDVARTLKPGTVIANFKLIDGKLKYPNQHGYHAAIFVRGEGFSVVTGKAGSIVMFDQWRGPSVNDSHAPSLRRVRTYTSEQLAKNHYRPANIANDFYVVLVP